MCVDNTTAIARQLGEQVAAQPLFGVEARGRLVDDQSAG
jgi:hypothetical protein